METSKKKRLRLFIIIAAAIVTVIAAAIITSELTLGHIVSANVICTGSTCSTPVFSDIDLKVDLNNFSFSVSNAESLAQVKKLADRAKSIDRAEKLNPLFRNHSVTDMDHTDRISLFIRTFQNGKVPRSRRP